MQRGCDGDAARYVYVVTLCHTQKKPSHITAATILYFSKDQRDGHPDHKPEDLTGFLAEVLAGDLSASSITWSSQEYKEYSYDQTTCPQITATASTLT